MDVRSTESPMDFQWQQGHGPARLDSPFMKAMARNSHQQDRFGGQKRSYEPFDSPKKPSFSSLRSPSSEASVFPSTPSMKLPVQFRNPSFTTPQRRIIDTDFSSGPENQSSPANGDTEDTPEPPRTQNLPNLDGAMVRFEGSRSQPPEKKYPSSGIFGKYVSAGRGEIARKLYADAAIRKVHKKRRRDADRDVRLAHRRGGHGYDSEELEDRARSRSQSRRDTDHESPAEQNFPPPYEMGLIPSIFHFIERHPRLPHILCHYAQVLLNFFLVAFCMYIVYSFWSTIKSDVDEKAREAAHEIMAEMAGCTREYKDNKCDSSTRVPAMEAVCNNWEKCMKQDPSLVGRASVSAYTFAGVLNSFFEPLHWKTVILSLSLLFGTGIISNLALSFLSRKTDHHTPPPPPNYFPPPTPQQQMGYGGGGGGGAEQYYPQYQGQLGYSGRLDADYGANGGGRESPSKRIGYEYRSESPSKRIGYR